MQRGITDEQSDWIADRFPPPATTGRSPTDRRLVVDAILWFLNAESFQFASFHANELRRIVRLLAAWSIRCDEACLTPSWESDAGSECQAECQGMPEIGLKRGG